LEDEMTKNPNIKSLLSQVTKGIIEKPELILIHGPDKVGKSTFASQAPDPIFLGPEAGTANMDHVARFPRVETFDQVLQAINELMTLNHSHKTLAIDSLDWIEPLIYAKICKEGGKKRIEDFGYGSGYKQSLDEWRILRDAIVQLQEKTKMNVILIAHSEIKTFNDPQTNASYDRYQLKLYDRASALMRELVEVILFSNFETTAYKENKGDRKAKAFGEGNRFIYTERRPAFDAGNRFSLPFQIPLLWQEYKKAKEASRVETVESLKKSIEGLIENVSSEIRPKVVEQVELAGDNKDRLRTIRRRLIELTENQ